MKRISSLFAASALAILPISAFAQQPTAPAKSAEPTGVTAGTTATDPAGTMTGDTTKADAKPGTMKADTMKAGTMKADTIKPGTNKSGVGGNVSGKSAVHGMNTATTTHHTKTSAPAKSAEPAKS